MEGDLTFRMIWWVLLLPLFGFLVQSLLGKIVMDSLGKRVGRLVMGGLAVAPVAIAFVIALGLTKQLAGMHGDQTVILTLFEWITTKSLSIPFEFRVDTLSMTMVLIITGIGSLIHLYATAYMAEDKDYTRFFTYLNLFVAAMLILVLGNNLALLFIGWEGVGVCSYLLIGFWYHDIENSKAANKAFIVNRIGDYGLTLGMFLIVMMMAAVAGNGMGFEDPRWLSYDVIFANIEGIKNSFPPAIITLTCILLFIGAMGKSAQFPLYLWLPDAMAGPTPVSALIHAATMVTSGVFLLNRMSWLFELSPVAGMVVTLTGVITAAIGAIIAFGQTDIKKVLAFSTVSQLGYMFVACGVGAYWVGLFHVTTHAFFKALLFLGSGAVIYAMQHNQDMRNYGNLTKFIKITSATMIVGWLAIAGFPFLSGFFSKEEILHAAQAYHVEPWVGQVAFWGALAVAVMTAAYMTRMTMMTFFSGGERWKLIPAHAHGHDHHHDEHHGHDMAHGHAHGHGDHEDDHGFFYSDAEMAEIALRTPHEHHHELDETHTPKEVPWMMWVPLVVLAVASIFGGAGLVYWTSLEGWLSSSVVVAHHEEAGHGAEHVATLGSILMEFFQNPLFWMSLTAFAVGVGYGVWRYGKGLPENDGMDTGKWNPLRTWAGRQLGYDELMSDGVALKFGGMVGRVLSWVDKTIVDGIVNGVGKLTGAIGGLFSKTQTGFVRGYTVLMQLGVAAVVIAILYKALMGGGQ